jgi:hypothetical protein
VYKSTIVRDVEYALREKREARIERVRIIEHIRGNRWKAQWIDPNSGLVHYVCWALRGKLPEHSWSEFSAVCVCPA